MDHRPDHSGSRRTALRPMGRFGVVAERYRCPRLPNSVLYYYPNVTDRPMTEVNPVVRSRHGLSRHHGLGTVGGRGHLPDRPPALPTRAVHAHGPDDAKSAIAHPARTGAGIDRGATPAASSGARAPGLVNVLFCLGGNIPTSEGAQDVRSVDCILD